MPRGFDRLFHGAATASPSRRSRNSASAVHPAGGTPRISGSSDSRPHVHAVPWLHRRPPTRSSADRAAAITWPGVAIYVHRVGPAAGRRLQRRLPPNADVGATVMFTGSHPPISPTSWAWDFGDGGTSDQPGPDACLHDPGDVHRQPHRHQRGRQRRPRPRARISASWSPGHPSRLRPCRRAPGDIRSRARGGAAGTWRNGTRPCGLAAGWQDVTPYGITRQHHVGQQPPGAGHPDCPRLRHLGGGLPRPRPHPGPQQRGRARTTATSGPICPSGSAHRGTIVRVGYVTGISHNFKYPLTGWRATCAAPTTSAAWRMPRCRPTRSWPIPCYARAVDAIAAAGLSVSVAAPAVPTRRVPVGHRYADWSVWEWIKDAAQEVLHIPYHRPARDAELPSVGVAARAGPLAGVPGADGPGRGHGLQRAVQRRPGPRGRGYSHRASADTASPVRRPHLHP